MATVIVDRIVVGNFPGSVELTCLDPLQPYSVDMTDVDTGEQYHVTLCANPADAPCSGQGVLKILETSGYVMGDTPCTP